MVANEGLVSVPTDLPVGTELVGYRIDGVLGRGGMGIVYLAEDLRLKRKVALKLLSPELAEDERFRERLIAESELAASLDHPNIVPIYSAGDAAGGMFISMRYVEGEDLKRLLSKGPLAPEQALALVAQVAGALDAAHARGLVHGDVKPSNVLVTPEAGHEGADHVYLADFGLTRRLAEHAVPDGSGQLLGTVDYVAPELIEGREVDGRADLYSLGCVLYECLAGEPPFPHGSDAAVLFAHLDSEPPTLPGLERVLATALAKSPDDRYSSCRELIEAARAASRGKVLARRKRRRPLVLAGIAVVAAAGATVGGVLATGGASTTAGPPEITQTAIDGARLGLPAASYDRLFGERGRKDVFNMPQFNVDIFGDRGLSAYFDQGTDRGIIVTTWNKNFRTAAGIGPCSTIADARASYGSAFRPSSHSTIKGKVYAYLLGRNLVFAANGKPPHPSKYVTAVALYDGSAPGADKPGGTVAYAGFVALSETNCR